MNLQLLHGEWRTVRRSSLKLMHNSLSLVGLIAVGVSALLFTQPHYARTFGEWMSVSHKAPAGFAPQVGGLDAFGQPGAALAPFDGRIASRTEEASRLLGLTNKDTAPGEEDAPVMRNVADGPALTREQREVSRYLSRKYRVNDDAIAMVVDAAYVTGKDLRMDPILLLAVMAIESGFNPFAQSTAGASGLMQVMSKVHSDKLADFGGPNIALNPVANLRVGAVVLKDCIRRGGSVADGLRLYVGAGTGDDNGYGARVLQEKERIAQAVHGAARPHAEPIPAANGKSTTRARASDAHEGDKAGSNKVEAAADGEEARVASL
jgi:soluble lytic murein transglycosylase-like protein